MPLLGIDHDIPIANRHLGFRKCRLHILPMLFRLSVCRKMDQKRILPDIGTQFCQSSLRHFPAFFHNADRIAKIVGFLQIVRSQKNGCSKVVTDLPHHIPHSHSRLDVHTHGGLVKKQDHGV
ncbi:hypothetical protein SDC9_166881 [bioreactor metagenome]|uniref:Uncharacterized protein n=1 Tax=bioreactor metagenome TaxID=1076179 RepID=A0A645G0T4_9ZZZZ